MVIRGVLSPDRALRCRCLTSLQTIVANAQRGAACLSNPIAKSNSCNDYCIFLWDLPQCKGVIEIVDLLQAAADQ
jgi:hypothetical protein